MVRVPRSRHTVLICLDFHRACPVMVAKSVWFSVVALVVVCGVMAVVPANIQAQARPPLTAQAAIDNQPVKLGPGPFRKLAPGVEQVILPQIDGNEQSSRHDIIEILAVDPKFGEREYQLKDKDGNPKGNVFKA